MFEFITNNMGTVLLTLISAGLLGFCRYIWKQMKTYKIMLEEKEKEETEALIDRKLEPIIDELEDLRAYIHDAKDIEKSHMNLIIASYRYRLIQLCKIYMKQGYMTQDQYEQLNEFYKLYTGLGGNGQATDYYNRAIQLPVRDDEE